MYEDTLLQLSRDTRFRSSEPFVVPLSEGRNPACGDEVALSASLDEGSLTGLRFHAQACAVCVASAAALCQELAGCDLESARQRVSEAIEFFDSDGEWQADWGDPALLALGAVRARPMRMVCVKLAWKALADVL